MRSEFQQWLYDLQELASKENIIIEAIYYDGLDYFFKAKFTLEESLKKYKELKRRCVAINSNPS